MGYRGVAVALLTAMAGCFGSVSNACEINLLVMNFTGNIITDIHYRGGNNLLPSEVEPNGHDKITWNGDGSYDLEIKFTNRSISITAADICNKSQLIANTDGAVVQ